MCKEPVGFSFRGLFSWRRWTFNVESRSVHWSSAVGDQQAEGEGQEILNVSAFFERVGIITLQLVACILPMVEGQLPTKEVAS